MARFSEALLFSKYFEIDRSLLDTSGLIDPFLNVDTHLFIDPILLEKSANSKISNEAVAAFKAHFSDIVRLLFISKAAGDVAWKAARKRLDLSEAPFNGLGFGKGFRDGNSRPEVVRETILQTMKEIIQLGSDDPEMISLMGFFEENVGPDTISDLTSRVIEKQLGEITHQFCVKNNVNMKFVKGRDALPLPHYVDTLGREKAIILVPADIVRALPIANDWSDLQAAIDANANIRDRVSSYLSGIAKPTVIQMKEAVKSAATSSANSVKEFIEALKLNAEHYDKNVDAFAYYKMKEILASGPITI